jgi:hypothetical protein
VLQHAAERSTEHQITTIFEAMHQLAHIVLSSITSDGELESKLTVRTVAAPQLTFPRPIEGLATGLAKGRLQFRQRGHTGRADPMWQSVG